MLSIKFVQLDPVGLCNCKCWFCPVAYKGNPKNQRRFMPLVDFEHILNQLDDYTDTRFMWTGHYNETLLHPEWPFLYERLRVHGWQTLTLTNGMLLTPANVEALESSSANVGILVNCPSAFPVSWSTLTGISQERHAQILRGLELINASPRLSKMTSIQINVPNEMVTLGDKAPYTLERLQEIAEDSRKLFREMFPNLCNVYTSGLIDRAGHMPEALLERQRVENPTRCVHTDIPGGRMGSGLHISATGDLFLCCNDFDMSHKYGNILQTPLKELWEGPERQAMIKNALCTICKECSFAR